MFRQDGIFRWKPGYHFIRPEAWDTVAGTPSQSVVNSLGMKSVQMDTNGDAVGMYLDFSEVPYLDTQFPVRVKVRWSTGSATAADTVQWIVLIGAEDSESGAASAAATALDRAIGSDTVGSTTAYTIRTSPEGLIKPEKFSRLSRGMLISVEMDAKAAGLTEPLHFLGLELKYTPKYFECSDGMRSEAKDSDLPLQFWRSN